jgi:hypothetical protein
MEINFTGKTALVTGAGKGIYDLKFRTGNYTVRVFEKDS